jgi:ribosome recycling factor
MIDEVLDDLGAGMQKTIDALQDDLLSIRTGRASPALVEKLPVDYYGTKTPLNQMASIAAPEPRLLVIRPWDPSALADIERAILKSDLSLTPMNDGKLIRLSIPRLTEERRKELVKVVSRRVEEARVAIRNIRRDSNELVKSLKKDGDISEDDAFRGQEQVQKITDEYVAKVDELVSAKEKEIMEF